MGSTVDSGMGGKLEIRARRHSFFDRQLSDTRAVLMEVFC
jgi:hypothetical protein